jgi:hypothetical protein
MAPESEISKAPDSVHEQPKRPILARALFLAATLVFLLLTGITGVTIGRRVALSARNSPALLLAADSTNRFQLPELPPWKTDLSAEDLAFGRQQVAQMVKDRPEMARWVREEDAVWEFCVRGFAGAAIGESILWNSTIPLQDFRADHLGPYKGAKGYIRLRNIYASGEYRGKPLPCEVLWAGVVFEIENMRSTSGFNLLHSLAIQGKLTREEWILGHTKLEYAACHRAAEDYQRLWRPLAATRPVSRTPELWGCNLPKTYEAWIILHNDPKGYPWNVFGAYYDQTVMPYRESVKRWRKYYGSGRSSDPAGD